MTCRGMCLLGETHAESFECLSSCQFRAKDCREGEKKEIKKKTNKEQDPVALLESPSEGSRILFGEMCYNWRGVEWFTLLK